MSDPAPAARGSGQWHFLAIVLITLLVMAFGVLVVVAPDLMGVPQMPETPAATPVATGAP